MERNNVNVAVGGPVNSDYPKVYNTVFIKPNIPFALQVTEPNTKYVIRHKIDLGSKGDKVSDVDFTNADTHEIADITYYYVPFTANGKPYTLLDDSCVFITSDWTGLSARTITPEAGTLFMIGSVTGGLHRSAYINGEVITMPENCILEFDGGSLDNGVIVGQDTLVINVGDVEIWGENLTREGTWREKQGGGGSHTMQNFPLSEVFEDANLLLNPFFDGSDNWDLTNCSISDKEIHINGKGWAKQNTAIVKDHKYLAVAFVKVDSIDGVEKRVAGINYSRTGIGFRIKDATPDNGSYLFNVDSISMLRPVYYTPVVYTFIAYNDCDPDLFFGELYNQTDYSNPDNLRYSKALGSIAHVGLYDLTDVAYKDLSYKNLYYAYKAWIEEKLNIYNPINSVIYPDTLAFLAGVREMNKVAQYYRMSDSLLFNPSGIGAYYDEYNEGNTYLTTIIPRNVVLGKIVGYNGVLYDDANDLLCVYEYEVNPKNTYMMSGIHVTYPNKIVIVTYWKGNWEYSTNDPAYHRSDDYMTYSDDYFRPVMNDNGVGVPEIWDTDRYVMIPQGCTLIRVLSERNYPPVLKCYSETPVQSSGWENLGVASGESGILHGYPYTKTISTSGTTKYIKYIFEQGNPFNDGDTVKVYFSQPYASSRIYMRNGGDVVDFVNPGAGSPVTFTYREIQGMYLTIQSDKASQDWSQDDWDEDITIVKTSASSSTQIYLDEYDMKEFRLTSNRSSCRDLCILAGHAATDAKFQEVWNLTGRFTPIYEIGRVEDYRMDPNLSRSSAGYRNIDWFTISGKGGEGGNRRVIGQDAQGNDIYEYEQRAFTLCAKNRTTNKWFAVAISTMNFIDFEPDTSDEVKALNKPGNLLLALLKWGNGDIELDMNDVKWNCCVYEVYPDLPVAFDDVDMSNATVNIQTNPYDSALTKFYANYKGKNERYEFHPMSTMKLLTCMVAFKHLDMTEICRPIVNDATLGSGYTWLEGEYLEVREAIYVMMTVSDNTIATALNRMSGLKILESRNSFVIDKV